MSEILWRPTSETYRDSNLSHYLEWLSIHKDKHFQDYEALWQWSVTDLEGFWQSVWDYFGLESHTPIQSVLEHAAMPGAQWFTGATLNFVNQVFKNKVTHRPAIVYQSEQDEMPHSISWAELEKQVAAFAQHLRSLKIRPGDRVVAYLPNRPEAIVAFLACASIGAVWSMCAPDLGTQSVLDRFQQIEPKVLVAVAGYEYGGKHYDRRHALAEIVSALPTLHGMVLVGEVVTLSTSDFERPSELDFCSWRTATARPAVLNSETLPFDHPLWILYSSGTTGKPKAIVHSHGGILVEYLKAHCFHLDIKATDRFLWYSSTAWMVWNFHVGSLLLGATVCIYEGHPGWPDSNRLWKFVQDAKITVFGAGAAFFDNCRNEKIRPNQSFDMSRLRVVGSTGSPLLPDAYRWIYEQVGSEVYLISISGGTDFASGFVGAVPTLPVYLGEMSCRCLGCAVYAFDEEGNPVTDQMGELVCTQPLPSMPLYFWNDPNQLRYRESYFDVWPGVWRHGDWISITSRGTAIIYGRSDSTINRLGIRTGTSELYAAVERLPEVVDSLVVDLEFLGRDSYMPLFVVLVPGQDLTGDLRRKIADAVRKNLSPRHVPNDIFEVTEVPRTFSGKKIEIPIRKLFLGEPAARVINKDTMLNPDSLNYFIDFAKRFDS